GERLQVEEDYGVVKEVGIVNSKGLCGNYGDKGSASIALQVIVGGAVSYNSTWEDSMKPHKGVEKNCTRDARKLSLYLFFFITLIVVSCTRLSFPSKASRSSLYPPRSCKSTLGSSASIVDNLELLSEQWYPITTGHGLFEEPRSFPYSVKQQCWEKAKKGGNRLWAFPSAQKAISHGVQPFFKALIRLPFWDN
ncbi:unnamed protein product, partial [Dovyalis caffra]